MTIYEKHNNTGEAWFRRSDGKKLSGNTALSAFGEKYSNISDSIVSDLSTNRIKRLEIIQDVILLETPSGFFIDKFEISGGIPIPVMNYNNSKNYPNGYSMDYWFDETGRKIYTVYGGISAFPSDDNLFVVSINAYDMDMNIYSQKLTSSFSVSAAKITNLEPFKLCYNTDTKLFNVSTIFNIGSNSSMNLLSINLKNSDYFEIDSLNIVLSE